MSNFLGDCDLAFDAFLHSMGALCGNEDKVSEERKRRKWRRKCLSLVTSSQCSCSHDVEKNKTVITLHPPSQATLCWQGQNRTSRASSEQMRHSLGPGGVGRTRLVMVLGVVWTLRRLALLRPWPQVMACSRCNLRHRGTAEATGRDCVVAAWALGCGAYLCFSAKLLMSCSTPLSATRSRGLLPLWLA